MGKNHASQYANFGCLPLLKQKYKKIAAEKKIMVFFSTAIHAK